jgi:hypothetical protein
VQQLCTGAALDVESVTHRAKSVESLDEVDHGLESASFKVEGSPSGRTPAIPRAHAARPA